MATVIREGQWPVILTYPHNGISWLAVAREIGGGEVWVSDHGNTVALTQQHGCTITPLVALDAATVEALEHLLLWARHTDFEDIGEVKLVRQLLAQVGDNER